MHKSKRSCNFASSKSHRTPEQEDKVGNKNMAKYTVTYKCGCTATIELYGKIADRESKIEWYKTIVCPSCRANAAQKEAELNNLCNLEGSEKQIAWALDIRNKALKISSEFVSMATNQEMAQKFVGMLMAESKASFWIENRFDLNGTPKEFAVFLIGTYKNQI